MVANVFAFIGPMGTSEMLILGVIAVLLFGSRLPSVARSLGKSIVEFKKGMNDLHDEVRSSIDSEPKSRVGYRPTREDTEPAAPKFEPPKAESEEHRDQPAEQLVK
jgi:sec-independent protein translocase protein TatA